MQKGKERFLSKVNIVTFKGLQNVTLEGIGQINLIVGDNNVGKTSVLEALVFDNNPYKFLANLSGIYFSKSDINDANNSINAIAPFVNSQQGNNLIQINAQFTSSKKIEKFSISYREINPFTENSKTTEQDNSEASAKSHITIAKNGSVEYRVIQSTEVSDFADIKYIPFISSKVLYADDLLGFYSRAVVPSKNRKDALIQDMKFFIPELEDIEISTDNTNNAPLLITRVANLDLALPLSMYGDGSIKFFRMLLEIAISTNNRLMIDEIDSGIHFSRMKSLWRVIIRSAIQNNTQLFITTHNDECLLFFKQVLEEEYFVSMQDECKCYTLRQLPDKTVKAYKYDFANFSFAINQQIELRGGNI